ncbi:hypothetical protein OH76DRAFT_1491134 [Lentinus brumalis]|uniref:Uncharacterized protein n=1 Tax=Lentinus brumalis TaxID=2498619 RepID=A0A371CGP7_9APHY|nr:hypothetical protein OH76DRAFT_1491134 [Polyporus brumalis]
MAANMRACSNAWPPSDDGGSLAGFSTGSAPPGSRSLHFEGAFPAARELHMSDKNLCVHRSPSSASSKLPEDRLIPRLTRNELSEL